MFGDRRVYQLPAVGLEHGQGTHLVQLHEAAVADHIGGEYGGQTTFHMQPFSRWEIIELPYENLRGERMSVKLRS